MKSYGFGLFVCFLAKMALNSPAIPEENINQGFHESQDSVPVVVSVSQALRHCGS